MSTRPCARLALAVTGLALAALGAARADERPAILGAGRVVLVPLNLGVVAVAEVAPGLDPVWRSMLELFASEERPLVALDRTSAEALWSEVIAEEEPGGEQSPGLRLRAARERFARRVSEQLDFEAIVFPTLITRRARVEGRSARWDHVSRPVEVPGQDYEEIDTLREGKITISRSGARGELAAASIHLAVLEADGSPRFEGTGGLVLLQELVPPARGSQSDFTVAARAAPFADARVLREGILAAFR